MPIMVTGVTWTLLACGYTFSGLDKLSSPSWINGEAVGLLLDNPLAREGFLRDLMLEAPPAALKLLTWGALGAEIFFLPLCFWRGGRLVAWTALLLLHFGIMLTLSFADLSLGMIMVHLFIFDQRWLGKGKAGTRAVVYYDGECGLCSRAMKFIAEEDTYDQIRLRALQGGAGQEAMAAAGLDPQRLDTMLVEKSGGFLTESRAVTGIAETLGGIWTIGQIANLLPREICDRAYQFVSKRRHAIFGRNRACEMPSEALRRKLAEVGEDGAEAAKER